jgi:AcrR family transcriptional regulator
MSKAKETKAKIIQLAANLFNQQGYVGSSLSDIMEATGLQKGGIYNHFRSKEELAIAAFDFAVKQVKQRHLKALRGKRHALEKLKAMVETFSLAIDDLPIKGGCPLLNTAVESDDTHPALRAHAQKAMDEWRQMIRHIVEVGMEKGEIQLLTAPDTVATIFIATLEGGLMMSKLYGDRVHLKRATEHLIGYADHYLKSP